MNLESFVLILRNYILIIPRTGMKQLALKGEKVVLIILRESPDFLLVTQAGVYLVPSVAIAYLHESS